MAIRTQENSPLPFPNGWFAVAWSKDLVAGQVEPIHYFGEDLVLFRTRGGSATVLDAYCPHLGAHLGYKGRVVGESIRCPFHGWRFDAGGGHCVEIPYCDQIPSKATVGTWPVQEKNGMIFVWYHDRKEPPAWDFPAMAEIGHPDWAPPRTFEIELPAHVQDTQENNNDPVHFQFVHKMVEVPESVITYGDDGRTMHIEHTSQHAAPGGTMIPVTLTRHAWGIGLTAVAMGSAAQPNLLMYSSTTPIESNRALSRWLLTAPLSSVDYIGEEFLRGMTEGVHQDFPIWRNKVHRAKPVLCKADRPLVEYRKWVKQFYSVPPDSNA